MNLPSEEIRFAKNATIMADAIYTGVDKLFKQGYQVVNPNLVKFASEIIKAYDQHELIRGFIKNSHQECWDKIKVRDEEYFINNVSSIFSHLPMDMVMLFKDLFLTKDANGKNVVESDIKNSIWGLLDAMIKISIKYILKQRLSGVQVYDDVDLVHHGAVWNVAIK